MDKGDLASEPWTKTAIKKLLEVMESTENYKVLIAIAQALASPPEACYGAFLQPIWRAILGASERLYAKLQQDDEALAAALDDKYHGLLQAQLRFNVVHLITCTTDEELTEMGPFLVGNAPLLQKMLQNEPQAPDSPTSPTGSPGTTPVRVAPGEEEEELAGAVVDDAVRQRALSRLVFLFQHQVLYAAVAECQREEERGCLGPGGIPNPRMFALYRTLAGILTEQHDGASPVVPRDVLAALQDAVDQGQS